MTSRLKKLDLCILQSLGDVRFIGIHGMGGIGKSTLARAYYKRMFHNFEGHSFIPNVREVCQKKENGLVHLQKQLLSDILNGNFEEIGHIDKGTDMIKSRLRHKRVLIVLDDVSKLEQLDALAEEDKWFGSGSIIIVTTREESFIKGRYTIYKAEYLNPSEALKLFSSKAFQSIEPPEEYKQLSKQVIEYAEYLPLALTVLGCLLRSKRRVSEWESALSRLRRCPAKEIHEKLKISFDDLEETDQRIFLDIACFFKGHDINNVIPILDSCGFSSEYGISNLTEKSLLEIQHGRKLLMRDLLQKMAHEIVREESAKPGGPSRLWDVDDFKRILLDKSGMENVEAIVLKFQEESTSLSFDGLSNMKKLRLLIILCSFHIPESDGSTPKLNYLSNNLRQLEWYEFPFKEFPSSFWPDRLVRLKLIKSNLQRLWKKSINQLPNLKVIDLSESKSFITFGNFWVVPNLEMLILSGCTKLSEIDHSITVLEKLTMLNLNNCASLTMLPPSISGLNSLKTFSVHGCSKLGKLPDDLGDLKSLKHLDVKKVFWSILNDALKGQRYKTFFDDDDHDFKLILRGIEESHSSIVVFSEKYAFSIPRLNELVQIVECMERKGHIVLPIFYHVDPSHVRKQLGSYKDAFNMHKNNPELDLMTVRRWRFALTTVGNLAGWTLQEKDIEAHFIQDFLQDIARIFKDELIFCDEDSETTAATIESLQRHFRDPSGASTGFDIIFPGSKIPPLFRKHSSSGGSISLRVNPIWFDSSWMGLALVACFRPNPSNLVYCDMKFNNNDWKVRFIEYDYATTGNSDQMWLFYYPRHKWPVGWLRSGNDVRLQFSFYSKVKPSEDCGPCGVGFVYKEDIEEFNQQSCDPNACSIM
ncbi:hypothetical protein FNV43_RR00713 [Rhamnella rubrinervis]|uniref:TIR domain-containing protein n=1 Tax=Rhamnella rubrinervis TaxID=2594499 RepID=A0A8K0HP56_9ROSA|nr:hypothetical protein FNV43_RR00713 [Rhamnella rubrinervis]